MRSPSMRLLVVGAMLASGGALADVTITTATESDKKDFSIFYVAGGKVRMEYAQGPEPTWMLWQSGVPQMTMVMPKKKTYMVMDKAQLDAAAAQANQAMKDMEEQLQSLPPEMRAQIMKNLPGAGGKPLVELKISKTGRTEQHAGYSCQIVDVTITGIPMVADAGALHCVVPAAKLGIPDADMQTMRAMAEFMKEMTKSVGHVVGNISDPGEMGGLPVWSKDKHDGKSWGISSITKSVDPSVFTVPAGYKQEQMPQMGEPSPKKKGKG